MTHYDLAVIGSGSGNSIVDRRFADRRVALVEHGTFGGTCLNVGCIPTKMFVHPADLAGVTDHADRVDVDLRLEGVRWPQLRDRIFRRIDPISEAGRRWRRDRNEHVTLVEEHARFVGLRELETDSGERISADLVVIAAGSRAVVPDIPGLESVPHHTSDTVMRLDELPRRLAIIGGGLVSAEFAHVFGSFGTEVTVVNRSNALLRSEDEEVSERFTELARDRWDVRLGTTVDHVEPRGGGVRLHLEHDGEVTPLDVDVLLVATGRVSNADLLDPAATGVEVDDAGRVVVDDYQRTTAEGVWALGDVSSAYQLKHVANLEARVVQHNLLHPDDLVAADHRFVPSAVFTSPQVASVGLTEREAAERGTRYVTSRQMYADVAYGWGMEDTTSFAKVLADPETGLILGGHIIGPHASVLIQPLVQAMSFGQTAREVARGQYWIHPALSEVVENALLGLDAAESSTATPG